MKRREAIELSMAVVGLLAVAHPAGAQGWRGWRGSEGWAGPGPYQRLYNPQSTYSAAGTIESVQSFIPIPGMAPGVHAIVRTASETVDLHLGPVWYVERLEEKLQPGDQIEFRGSRVMINGKPVVIAAEITKGGSSLALRDAAGVPAWAGWRR